MTDTLDVSRGVTVALRWFPAALSVRFVGSQEGIRCEAGTAPQRYVKTTAVNSTEPTGSGSDRH